jgi:hypothetical protein
LEINFQYPISNKTFSKFQGAPMLDAGKSRLP